MTAMATMARVAAEPFVSDRVGVTIDKLLAPDRAKGPITRPTDLGRLFINQPQTQRLIAKAIAFRQRIIEHPDDYAKLIGNLSPRQADAAIELLSNVDRIAQLEPMAKQPPSPEIDGFSKYMELPGEEKALAAVRTVFNRLLSKPATKPNCGVRVSKKSSHTGVYAPVFWSLPSLHLDFSRRFRKKSNDEKQIGFSPAGRPRQEVKPVEAKNKAERPSVEERPAQIAQNSQQPNQGSVSRPAGLAPTQLTGASASVASRATPIGI